MDVDVFTEYITIRKGGDFFTYFSSSSCLRGNANFCIYQYLVFIVEVINPDPVVVLFRVCFNFTQSWNGVNMGTD